MKRPAGRPGAGGGLDGDGQAGYKTDCLAYIEEVWTDMRPLSVRKKVADGG